MGRRRWSVLSKAKTNKRNFLRKVTGGEESVLAFWQAGWEEDGWEEWQGVVCSLVWVQLEYIDDAGRP